MSEVLVGVLLAAVMLLGGYFRFVGLNWDDFTHLHPDERFLTGVAVSLGGSLSPTDADADNRELFFERCLSRYPDTGGEGTYFDAQCSTWNPNNTGHGLYVYGTLPLFMARLGGELMVIGSEWWAQNVLFPQTGDTKWLDYDGVQWVTYDGIHLVWRFLSAMAEMGVIVIVFLIGTKLHDKWVGLLAAFLYAVTVFSIQMAHFGTVDAISNFFAALTILFAVVIQQGGRFWNYLWFGVFFGASVAGRINLLPLLGLVILAAGVRALPAFARNVARSERERLLSQAFLGVLTAAVVGVVVFRLANPYAFSGPGVLGLTPNPRWLEDMGTAQRLVSGTDDAPPNYQWTARTSYLFPLNNMVLWGMGLPLGLAAWAGFIWGFYRLLRGKPGALANILLLAWVAFYFGYMGRQWVMTMRYFLPIYPALIILAAWGLIGLVRYARERAALRRGLAALVLVGVAAFSLLWSGMFTNIYRNLLTRVAATHWVWENVPGDFAMRVDGVDAPLMQIGIPRRADQPEDDLVARVTRFDSSMPVSSERFVATATGTVSSIHAPHLGDPNDDPDPETLRFTITREGDPTPLAEATLSQPLRRDEREIIGYAYDIPLEPPLQVEAGQAYTFNVELVEGGPVISGGSIFTWEGAWDDPVPTRVCALPDGVTLADEPPPGLVMDGRECRGRDAWWGLVNGYQLNIVYEDDEYKRERVLLALDNSDYIAISSNRFYDSMARNPQRWPMTMRYYEALFSGELGYELAATFEQTFELGPLRVSDQHLPTYESPEWLNEFEVEEAFHVYDHPTVFIFRKSDAYDPQIARDILSGVSLVRSGEARVFDACPEVDAVPGQPYFCDPTLINVATLSSEQADRAPTGLRMSDEQAAIQGAGGTWSQRFFPTSPINSEPVGSVVLWWIAILFFGWAAWPLLFAVFPGLADRGYGLAKFAGIFLVAWGTWFLASARLAVWTGAGILGGLIVLFALGVVLVWPRRAEFFTYLRENRRLLLGIEGITLAAYLAFVVVRLTNPDLWHQGYGGEKPMDFAYFNAVLRSTIFPPIDPWFSGGFINYYYFGFVIAGAPVLLTGVMPSIAYNLLLPTLFAVTGIGAFSVAYNIVASGRLDALKRLGSPWIAGIAALLMAVVFGNLDTPRVFLTSVAQAGGYQQPPRDLLGFLIQDYTSETGAPPSDSTLLELTARAQENRLSDQIEFEINNTLNLINSIGRGIEAAREGREIYVSPDRWFWGPSRVLAETPGVEGNAITEMPIFTFVYGDLHAHMIAMPMQFLVMAFLLNEVLLAGRDRRRSAAILLALAIGAITVGMLRATNTWDWITYILFGAAGLGFAWWLRQRAAGRSPISRHGLLDAVWYIGFFVGVSFIAVQPYTSWFAQGYNRVLPWEGGKTPIWAYLVIHGLFVFLLFSLLLWDTARWLRESRVGSLRGSCLILLPILLALPAVAVGIVVLTGASYQVTLIAAPLLLWCVVLFFRAGQTRGMQFVLALAGLALALTLGVEYVVLDGDIGRQNTVFKFYIQAWLLFSVAGGVALAWLMQSASEWRGGLRFGWSLVLLLLVATASLFPIMATRGKAVFRMASDMPLTLDGAAFMRYANHFEGDDEVRAEYPETANFPLAEDYALIRWLQDNVQGSPVIIEGQSEGTEYKWNARISIYTGLPSVVGWNWHQRQQRVIDPQPRFVEMRSSNVNAFYETFDIKTAWDILRFYDVSYIIVGRLERAYYPPDALAKFERMVEQGLLEVAFQTGESAIYRVNKDAAQVRVSLEGQG